MGQAMDFVDDKATAEEAKAAIKAGLTPFHVAAAIIGCTRHKTAEYFGFDGGIIRRLAARWGVE